MAKVDATVANTLAGRFEVSGYPTIKILKKGEAVEYDGERNEKGKCALRVGPWDRLCIKCGGKRNLRVCTLRYKDSAPL